MVKISGRLVEPADDKPRSGVTLTLHSVKNSSVVLKHATYRCVTGGNGEYSFNAAPGTYAVAVSVYGAEPERVGQIRVYSDSLPGNLNTFLMAPGESDLTPEIIRLVDIMRDEAVKAAESAKNSEKIVTDNAASVANNTAAVQRNTDQVAQNTQTVSVKAQQVSENTQSVAANTLSVTQMRDEVVAKTSMAQGAADTATQKAASAAEHDASSAANAKIAQDAAAAVQGALIDGGECDLSSGVYPPPQMVAGKNYSTVWYVKIGGMVSGLAYDVGDVLRYTTDKGGYYFRVDAVDTTTTQINAHAAKDGAHTINGVLGLTEALADKADAAAVAEGFRQHSDFRTGESRMFETRAQLAKRAAEYHPMDGQIVPRATDQGLLAAIIAGEVPSCSDADWLADPYKRNNYTLGDGATNIRLPDRNGKTLNTVGSVFARGDGDNAPSPGMIHGDASRRITGTFATDNGWGFSAAGGVFKMPASPVSNTKFSTTPADGQRFPWFELDSSLQVPTAPQNRPTSISRVWSVKR